MWGTQFQPLHHSYLDAVSNFSEINEKFKWNYKTSYQALIKSHKHTHALTHTHTCTDQPIQYSASYAELFGKQHTELLYKVNTIRCCKLHDRRCIFPCHKPWKFVYMASQLWTSFVCVQTTKFSKSYLEYKYQLSIWHAKY
jgi:hypothetical protein